MRKLILSLIGSLALATWTLAPSAMAAGGPPPGTGEDTTTTEVGNNLSVPTVFVGDTTEAPALNVPCGPTTTPQAPQGIRHGGYWEAASDGGVFNFGGANFYGSMGGVHLNKPVVGITSTSTGQGYWLVATDGGVFSFNAPFYGSTGNMTLNAPIVGMAVDPATGGYWLVARDGGVFSFNAPFFGSMGGTHLNAPVVGMVATSDGGGYTLVASDGGVFTFGNAPFYGSMGGSHLNGRVVGMDATAGGLGYMLVGADGGVFTFGNAPFLGSMGGSHLNKPVVGMTFSPSGNGYTLAAADGGIFTFGDATFYGSMGGTTLNAPVVDMSNYPGYWTQGTGDSTWSAYCTTAASDTVTASWSDNLKSTTAIHAGQQIRVEVALLEMADSNLPWLGYNMTNLTPTAEDRYATFGTDGTTFLSGINGGTQTHVWGPDATLDIEAGGTTTTIDPMSAEINASGAVVYGYNWKAPDTPDAEATLTFNIGTAVTIDGIVDGSVYHPTFNAHSTSITFTLIGTGGGGGGGGGEGE